MNRYEFWRLKSLKSQKLLKISKIFEPIRSQHLRGQLQGDPIIRAPTTFPKRFTYSLPEFLFSFIRCLFCFNWFMASSDSLLICVIVVSITGPFLGSMWMMFFFGTTTRFLFTLRAFFTGCFFSLSFFFFQGRRQVRFTGTGFTSELLVPLVVPLAVLVEDVFALLTGAPSLVTMPVNTIRGGEAVAAPAVTPDEGGVFAVLGCCTATGICRPLTSCTLFTAVWAICTCCWG